MSSWSRGAVLLHLLTGAAAVPVLLWVPVPQRGLALVGLLLAYNLAIPVWAGLAGQARWLRAWSLALPVSLLQLLPDAVLVNSVGTLQFPDLGAPRWLDVPLYMPLMWTIPLLWIAMARTTLGALALTLIVFTAAEIAAAPLRLWQAGNVQTMFGAALYVIPAELLLGLSFRWALNGGPTSSLPSIAWRAILVSLSYTGALLWCWLLIEHS